VITICSYLLLLSANAASRGISIISDLTHQSGKLGSYGALLIGINDYNDPKIPDLETAVNDVTAMAKLLKERYGFQVKLLLNRKATREGIYRALRKLASSAKLDDSVLIYYAGHGDLDRTYDDGWWIPVDAKGGNPVTYLDNGQVQKAMRSMKARHVLLISDSCYSGTLFGQVSSMPPIINDKYYLNLYNERSRWGITSGNKTPVSDYGTGSHSVFAYQLLKQLRNNEKPYISTQELYTRIAPIISNNSEQTPLCRPIRNTGDQGGGFVFVALNEMSTDIIDPNKADTYLDAERKRLEQERKELERIKTEIEEHKRIEAELKRINAEKKKLLEKQTLKYSSISPKVSKPIVVARDENFISYTTGVVYDKDTGLEWYEGPDKETSWIGAKEWVDNLNIAGGGWRMPTIEEIKTLFKKGAGQHKMMPLFKTTGRWIWSDKTKGSSESWGVYIDEEAEAWETHKTEIFYSARGFAVRSRK
jgi:hypothetical protein